MSWNTVIFDLDGTILDTLEDLKNSVNYALAQFDYPERSTAEVRAFVGNGVRRLCALAAPNGVDESKIDLLLSTFNEHYAVHCRDYTNPYPGIREIILTLRERKVKTAVVSNKPDYGVQSLCREFFPNLFDAAVGQRDGIRRKPWPDSVEEVMRTLNAESETTVYVGDSEVDIETAKNAGIKCISVDWGFRSEEQLLASGANTVVHNTDELFSALST